MELRHCLRILRERWWIVLAALLSTTVTTAVFTFRQTPVYQAEATYVVAPSADREAGESLVDVLDAMSRRAEIAGTYVRVATSREIQRQAAQRLGLSQTQQDSLSVDSRLVPETNVIEITVEGSNPQLVKNFADTVGSITDGYVQKLYEAYGLTPLDPALVPTSPVRPRRMLNLALGTTLGLALGAGLAFLFTYLDVTLRTPEEIASAVKLPTFAQIPVARARGRRSVHSLDGDPMRAEAFLRLRTRIFAKEEDMPLQSLLVTSAQPKEGKSTVVAHLAAAMARSGRRILAMDADLRKPTLHRFFDLDNQQGLGDILEERANLDEVVQSTDAPGLQVLTSGQAYLVPVADLVNSPRMEALLQEVEERYDLVLLDTPAWLSVADAAVLAPMTDGVLLVAGCAKVTKAAVQSAYQQLKDVKASVAGLVVNRVRRNGGPYYYDYCAHRGEASTKDPLTRISGIGPTYERTLNRLGILTFAQLAKQDPLKLAERMGANVEAHQLVSREWIDQARTWDARSPRDPPSGAVVTPDPDEDVGRCGPSPTILRG